MRAIELFAGAGGLGLGVSRAGFRPLGVIERDRHCCKTIRENQSRGFAAVAGWPLHEGDIRNFDFTPYEGRIDLVTGGPPCQPFSLGGRHKGFDDARDMWPEAVRAVRECAPRAFIFENVKGLTRAQFATYLAYIILQLSYPEELKHEGEVWTDHMTRLERHRKRPSRQALSYRVFHKVLNAANYGVPQKRERVVLIGFRRDLNLTWSFP